MSRLQEEPAFPGFPPSSSTATPAPVSPSPALSAYSYSSGGSSVSDLDDVGSYWSLDDWGLPTGSRAQGKQQQEERDAHALPRAQNGVETCAGAYTAHSEWLGSTAAVSETVSGPSTGSGSGSATPVNLGSGFRTKLSSPSTTPINSRFASGSLTALLAADEAQAKHEERRDYASEDGQHQEKQYEHELQMEQDPNADEVEGDAGDEFDLHDEDEEDMHASGVPAARGWNLDARLSDTPKFKRQVLDMFSNELSLAGWTQKDVHPTLWPLSEQHLHLRRISGALTNAVFFVNYKPPTPSSMEHTRNDIDGKPGGASSSNAPTPPPTVLLRVYGVGTEVLLSRRGELLILHTLSSLYEIGPHILGTFANGRVEEYFPCDPIGKEGIRDLGTREEYITKRGELHIKGVEGTAQWVARRMRELHEVPLEVMRTVLEQGDLHAPSEKGFGRGIQNHIMASSHRPRPRRPSSKPRGATGSVNAVTAWGAAVAGPKPGAAASVLPGGTGLMRESPGALPTRDSMPSPAAAGTSLRAFAAAGAKEAHEQSSEGQLQQQQQQQPSHALTQAQVQQAELADWNARFDLHRNGSAASVGSYGSAASFDSLATSFDSRISFSSSASSSSAASDREGGSGRRVRSPIGTPMSIAMPTPINPYFPHSSRERPGRSRSSNSATGGGSQLAGTSNRPYPGVWRRMKRWSREAAKVLQLFEDVAQSPAGKLACTLALRSAPHGLLAAGGSGDDSGSEGIDLRSLAQQQTITSDMLSSTCGNLCNTLLCIVAMDFPRLMRELDTFKRFIREWERAEGQSKRVFAHNDSQYGNLLVVKTQPPPSAAAAGRDNPWKSGPGGVLTSTPAPASGMPRVNGGTAVLVHARRDSSVSVASASGNAEGSTSSATPSPSQVQTQPQPQSQDFSQQPMRAQTSAFYRSCTSQARPVKRWQPHQQVVVIDFEYASPNPRAYDIANHFHEWRTDYHHPSLSWSLTHHGAYPDKQQRQKWLRAYVQQGRLLRMKNGGSKNALLDAASMPAPAPPTPQAQAQPPSDFSIGPPAIPTAKPASTKPAQPAAASKRQQSAALPATSSPSLTPFLRGVSSPRSPWLGASHSTVAPPPTAAHAPNPSTTAIANTSLARLDASIEREVDRLEREVNVWSPASHAVWGLWGIVFGRAEIEAVLERALATVRDASMGTDAAGAKDDNENDDVLLLQAEEKDKEAGAEEAGAEEAFDYLRYALGRIELFRYEIKELGIV
ncbi:kinase-like protein [Tilletiaria anomala UBC 951]|uniref:Kinase-like protein n=1 Tax=Tilletiaria anomala (strain ATCC 24038 / CBS 436.72 / UBC 951) TaxID=1037660 RepID=A0A066VY11_TILAU|nr:kinase-like protein [Tilletiaria anomala UBC 951]KDN43410.1 kinase-like protein [Tilletiaria anomala UBC 951]